MGEPRGMKGLEVSRGGETTRRNILLAGAAAALSACGWRGGKYADDLERFSGFNDRVSALLLRDGLAKTYPVSARSRERDFPAYFVSRGAMPPALVEPEKWTLHVGGLVRRPLMLTIEQIRAMTRLTYTVKHHCVEGWSAIATWTGVPFREIADRAEVLPQARYVAFRSFDSGYYNGWDLPSAMHQQTMLAYGFNDRELMPSHGAPLRLYSPSKLGYKLTKYLYAIEFTDAKPGGYWEDQGYPWFGGV